jgi:DNA-binding CsgD family transcriptional regulator
MALTTLIGALGEQTFWSELTRFLRLEVPFNSSVILVYPGEGEFEVVHESLTSNDRDVFNSVYREGLWAMSPLYLKASSGFRGAFHLKDLAPENFERSVFYQRYWCPSGISDQFAFISELDDGKPLVISLERTPSYPMFTKAEKDHLRNLSGLICALISKSRVSLETLPLRTPQALGQASEKIMDSLGSSLLTPREREVMEMLIFGHSNKTIAQKLGISLETVKVYCKNVNSKLGLKGRSDLYSRVLHTLLVD